MPLRHCWFVICKNWVGTISIWLSSLWWMTMLAFIEHSPTFGQNWLPRNHRLPGVRMILSLALLEQRKIDGESRESTRKFWMKWKSKKKNPVPSFSSKSQIAEVALIMITLISISMKRALPPGAIQSYHRHSMNRTIQTQQTKQTLKSLGRRCWTEVIPFDASATLP